MDAFLKNPISLFAQRWLYRGQVEFECSRQIDPVFALSLRRR